MGVGASLHMYVVVVKSSRSLSHLLMSSCFTVTVLSSPITLVLCAGLRLTSYYY